MKTILKIKFKSKDEWYLLDFGTPTTQKEFDEMFKLRYEVYIKEMKYGNQIYFPEEKEYDKYDDEKKCLYAIAMFNEKIIGTARLVVRTPLPLEEEYFIFREPEAIKKLPRRHWAELSRLISKPSLPLLPHLVMFGLFYVLLQYSFKYDLRVGFAVITGDLRKKIKKLKIPFYEINKFSIKTSPITQKFQGYFQKKKLSLIYFFRDEIKGYLDRVIKNEIISKFFGTEIILEDFSF